MSESVTDTIVTKIARYEGVDPTELPPLWNTIDTEALDRLVHSCDGETSTQIEFSYHGYDIVVDGTDTIVVTERMPNEQVRYSND